LGANIFHRPQTFLSKREHFSQAANIFLQAQWLGANIFHRPQTFPFERKDLAQSFQGSPIFKAKCARSKAKSKSKSKDKK
jgi:hypothetical protein